MDSNGDGVTDAGEWLTLEEAEIASLNLDYTNSTYTDANGNQHRQMGGFNWTDGTTGQMTDVWFQADLMDSRYLDEVGVPGDIKELPDLRGYGTIPSLHQAMAADQSGRLQSLMEQYINCADPAQARAMIWDILFAWTGVRNCPQIT